MYSLKSCTNKKISTVSPIMNISAVQDIRSEHMLLLLEFMYRGCISVPAAQLPEILRSASSLHIRGLTETRDPALATGAGEQLGRY